MSPDLQFVTTLTGSLRSVAVGSGYAIISDGVPNSTSRRMSGVGQSATTGGVVSTSEMI